MSSPAPSSDGTHADAGEHLKPDPVTAPVVKRIFALFLEGHGYYAIGRAAHQPGCALPLPLRPDTQPSPGWRAWNKHAVRAILTNPRYTGYEVWNRQRRDEVLLDVRDVAAGYTSKMRWNTPDLWVWSEQPAHRRWSPVRPSTRSSG